MSSNRRDSRFGQDEQPLTDFERDLQRRLFGKSQDFPPEFTSWLRLQVEKDPPRLLPTNVDRVYNVPTARVYHSTTQAVSTATLTTLTFNSERFDHWAMHDTTTNPSRLTAVKPGVYEIGGHVSFDDTTSTTGTRQVNVRANGSTLIAVDSRQYSGTSETQVSIATRWSLATGEYVELLVYQASGVTKNVVASSAYSPEFWMSFVADYPPS